MNTATTNCRLIRLGEIAIFQSSYTDNYGLIIRYRQSGVDREDYATNFRHAATCNCHLTVEPNAPKACSWCEAKTGIRTQGSHGICPSHFAEQVAQIKRMHA